VILVLVLSTTEKLVLLAVIVETGYGSRPASTGKVYARYVELSKLADIEPVTRRRVLDVIKYLAKTGILWTRVDSLGRYGRTTLIKLLAPPQTLCPALVEDLLIGEVAEEVCRNANPPLLIEPPHFCGGPI
jgi:cell division control protein 6